MCGIAGIVHHDATPVAEDVLTRMLRSLRHRGPDDSGTASDQGIGMAHTRLSILDLSTAGHQPWSEGSHALVYNGEIYNFRELRKELEQQGVEFSSTSDTEVLFASLVRHGVADTVARCRGMFAFAFADFEARTVHLCRDRFGIKPLYYHPGSRGLVFASEVKALREAVELHLHPVATLYSTAGVADQSNSRTIFTDVLQVPPGHIVLVEDGRPRTPEPYYEIHKEIDPDHYQELDSLTDREITDRFARLLDDAVERLLVSDAPMGAFVSGGVDSALIASIASRHVPGAFQLFTANVIGPHSELEDAQRLAAALGRPLAQADFPPERLIEGLTACTWHYEAPLVKHNNSVPFADVASLARRSGVKAVLTGEGADELFLGYPRLLTERYRPVLAAPRTAVDWLYRKIPKLADFIAEGGSAATEAFLGLAVQGYERQLLREEGLNSYGFLPDKNRRPHYETIQAMREGILALLHRNDRMGMMHSIEARFPFLDEEIVRFSVNLPLRRKIAWTRHFHNWKHPFLEDKHVVRSTASRVLPSATARKKKAGFPMHGFRELVVDPSAFSDGWVAQQLRLDARSSTYLHENAPPYELAKLFSIEVFARLFEFGQPLEMVDDWVRASARLATGSAGSPSGR